MRESARFGDAAVETGLDLRALARAVWARRMWIVAPTLLALAAMALYVTFASPRYTAEAKILLENQESFYTRPDRNDRDAGAPDQEAVQSQIQLVTSRDLARQAIRKLNLAGKSEFDPLAGPLGAVTRVLVLLGLQRDPTTLSPEDRMLENWFERLKVFSAPRTRVLVVEFTSTDPDLAARAANTVADLFIALRSSAKKEDARSAGVWLSSSIDDLRGKVAAAEAKVEQFRASNGLLVGANNTTITAQHLAELNTQLSNARSAQSESQAKARIIRDMLRQGRIFEIPDVAKDELIRRIAEQRVTLRAQLALESRTLLPAHPRIKELQAQIADIESELRAAADKTARTLESEARLAGGRVENLAATLEAQKREVAAGNGEEVQLRALEREAKSAREQLESYLGRYREAAAREGAANATPADARIISRAIAPPLPSFPKKLPMLALTFLGALILSSSVVLTRELLVGEVARVLPVAYAEPGVAGAIPVAARLAADEGPQPAPGAPVARHVGVERARAAASIEEVCDRIPAASSDGATRIVVAGLGVETAASAALGIGRALSRRGLTILVDLTGGERVVEALGSHAAPGVGDLLAGSADFAEVIHRDRATRLHLLPRGVNAPEDGEDLRLALDALVATYAHVVIAVAPAAGPTALALARAADVAVLATSGAEVDRARAEAAYAALRETGAPELLVVDQAVAADRAGRGGERDAA